MKSINLPGGPMRMSRQSSLSGSRSLKIKEEWLGLLIIPVINTINYYLTYSSMAPTPFFFFTYTIDTFQGWIAWYAGRWVILQLDQWFPYERGFLRRIGLQIVLTNVIMLLLISLMTELVNAIWGDGPLPWSFYTENLVIFFIWILFFNSLYVGIHLYRSIDRVVEPKQKKIEVRKGKQRIRLSENDILFFRSESDLVTATDKDGKVHYLDQSLKKIEPQLSESYFRANRQFLVHRNAIARFQSGQNGKIRVWLRIADNREIEINISRTKAAHYRKWIQHH